MIAPLIFFDLDSTLAESKQPLTAEMALLVSQLLAKTRVAVISGGALPQFLKQVVAQLPEGSYLPNLYLLPTSGAALFEYKNGEWMRIYEERLSEKEIHEIEVAMQAAIRDVGVIDPAEKTWGERIEHRGAQMSLSALGQQAPVEVKKAWDPDRKKREKLQAYLAPKLPEFLVAIGGKTTIDVTKRGIDKAYGVHQLCARLSIKESDALYVGDELRDGGNDEAVFKTEVQTKAVANPGDTEALISSLLTAA